MNGKEPPPLSLYKVVSMENGEETPRVLSSQLLSESQDILTKKFKQTNKTIPNKQR
jgi:hypothetical protein